MEVQHANKFRALPSNWRICKVGDLCKVGTGGTPSTNFPEYYEPATINWVKSGDVKGLYIWSAEHKISDAGMKNSAATPHPRGTVLMAMSGRGKTRGTTAILGIEAACSQSVAAIVPGSDVCSEFVHFQFVKRYSEIRAITGSDDRSGLNMSLIRDIALIVPPLSEQRKIASVLEVVQRAIEQQDRLITLTTELKKSLMHKLFTEGLRGELQKQTEIGPLPESWEVKPLRDCCIVQTGIAKGRKIEASESLTLPYLRVANVQAGYLDLSEMKTITIRRKEKNRYMLREGDVVLTEGGDFDKLGRGFIWNGEIADCVHQNHVFAVRADRSQLLPEFFAHLSQSPYGKAYFLSVAHKTTNLACINTTKLKAFPVLIPTLTEQEDIVQMLGAINAKLAQHVRKKQSFSDLFRTLLYQLMTAQIRVHDLDLSFLEQEAVAS
jgi:type I restriction enzyme S subunit